MLFYYRQRNIDKLIPSLKIKNAPIELVKEFNFLGIVLDECMTWNSHINKISSKLACAIGIFTRLKRFLPLYILKILYSALFLPYLNYGILLWGSNLRRITRLQKFAVRALTNSKYNAHTEPIFRNLRLLKVSDIFELNLLKFYFKYKNNGLPSYFDNMFEFSQTTHNYETRHRNMTHPRLPKTYSASNAIRFIVPAKMKKSHPCITDKVHTHSITGFGQYIKNYLISRYSLVCVISNCYVCNMH